MEQQSIDIEVHQLREALELKNRIIENVMAIDEIRDAYKEPIAMLNGIVNLIADRFETDLCLLALLDTETEQVELRAIHRKDRGADKSLDGLIRRDVVTKAMEVPQVTVWRNEPILDSLNLPDSVEIAVVPVMIREDEPLGVMLMAVRDKPFSDADIECLEYLEDHIDSAVIQGYNTSELQHRNRQLELIYNVDQIRDRHLPMDEMLNAVLQEVVHAIPSEMGFAMLYDQYSKSLSLRATTGEDLFSAGLMVDQLNRLVDKSLNEGILLLQNNLEDRYLRSVMCLPLILAETIIGVVGVVNRYSANGFTAKDRQLLSAVGSQIDTALYESLEKRHLRAVLDRAVGPRIMRRILEAGSDILKTEVMRLSVLYADIRGSTELSEALEPEIMVAFINDYLHQMNEVVITFEGTLDKFVGDEVMALFGAPFPQPDHVDRAIRVALEMQRVHRRIMSRWQEKGVETRPIGIGIATGELIVGEMGSTRRTDYTVMGRAANLGARICSMAGAGEVLICPETYGGVTGDFVISPLEPVLFKGFQEKTTVYHVQDPFATL